MLVEACRIDGKQCATLLEKYSFVLKISIILKGVYCAPAHSRLTSCPFNELLCSYAEDAALHSTTYQAFLFFLH